MAVDAGSAVLVIGGGGGGDKRSLLYMNGVAVHGWNIYW